MAIGERPPATRPAAGSAGGGEHHIEQQHGARRDQDQEDPSDHRGGIHPEHEGGGRTSPPGSCRAPIPTSPANATTAKISNATAQCGAGRMDMGKS